MEIANNTQSPTTIHNPTPSTRSIGAAYEDLAAQFLEEKGLILLARNFHSMHGEIDLIFRDERIRSLDEELFKSNQPLSKPNERILDQHTFIFVEVRFRQTPSFAHPLSSITPLKQKRYIKTASVFLKKFRMGSSFPCRFDVIAITLMENKPKIEWIQNAFQTH